jgi:hypothetical protein
MKRLLLAPLLLTLLVGCSTKDKTYIERRDDCADVYGRAIPFEEFNKKYKIALNDERGNAGNAKKRDINDYIDGFCQFYK